MGDGANKMGDGANNLRFDQPNDMNLGLMY